MAQNNKSYPDLVVTLDSDSIPCKILSETDKQLDVRLIYNDTEQEALILKEHILYYQKDFYLQAKSNEETPILNSIPTSPTRVPQLEPEPVFELKSFRINVSGGYSYRLGSVSDSVPSILKDHLTNLRHGFNIGVNAGYFLGKTWGVGLKYNYFKSKATLNDVIISFGNPPNLSFSGTLDQAITVHTFGPEMLARLPVLDNTGLLIAKGGIQYAWYKDEISNITSIVTKGETIIMDLGFEFDYFIEENWAFNIGGNIQAGSVIEFDYSGPNGSTSYTLGADEGESISRFNLTVGFSYWF